MPGFSLNLLNSFLFYVILGGVFAPALVWIAEQLYGRLKRKIKPPVTSMAVLIAKRPEVKTKDSNKKAYTVYFAAFELSDGKRMEFELAGDVYGLFAVGDKGRLTFHGKKFVGFSYANMADKPGEVI